ncbi:MAG: proton-conducting transporter membrane subunit [Nitrospira sp.]|nr:proton-conducting transporter membrane subunit [Nitrospira sp.]MDH4370694.1 proton-conducting transporter membrane subunit [Nitrospira sp.]MDH5348806.1 proton-conducting transporter membrane subunit [Nitrospira sp.]MDH5498797.1 proton-conducting transporter membrane subunit [Nitrospira sp.]MDH5723868.1 proton-conducting transporter membrane subunit [Nitrospira sp.]
MMEFFASSLLTAVPLLGALVSLIFWSDPNRVKTCSIASSILTLALILGLAKFLTPSPTGLLSLYLLPLGAMTSVLSHPLHEDHRFSWMVTLVCLGFGIGTLTGQDVSGSFFLMMLLATIIALLYRHHTALWPMSWLGVGLLSLGLVCLGISMLTAMPLSSLASLMTCAVLLPLVPFHGGYLTTVTRLPGNLPSFIVVLLPILGLHQLSMTLSTIPENVMSVVSALALAGALYSAVKALAQSRVRLILGYGSLSFFSIAWWFAATTEAITPRTALLVGAIGLATSGLLIAWQVIRTRYGDDVDPQAISGLAAAMPKYAVVLSLLGLAAMGIPPFGVFAGFMGLVLTSPQAPVFGLFLALAAWLAASWYIMQMVQQLLFGASRPNLRYTDLLHPELISLLIVVLALLVLGLAPSTLFGPEQGVEPPIAVFLESLPWQN